MTDKSFGPSSPPSELSHYAILDLTPQLVEDHKDPSPLIRRAYHRALLRHHPDKTRRSPPPSSSHHHNHRDALSGATPSSTASTASTASIPPIPSSPSAPSPTVDRISEAFRILHNPTTRAAYGRELKLLRQPNGRVAGQWSDFQTGVEAVDLDDFDFDETGGLWFRRCRCGNERGFHFTETALEDVGDAGELLVGCQDCSLWIRVHFAIMDE